MPLLEAFKNRKEQTPTPEIRPLEHNEEFAVNLEAGPIMGEKQTRKRHGLEGSVIATIQAATETYDIIDQRQIPEAKSPFLLVKLESTKKGKGAETKAVEINPARALVIGRESTQDIFEHNENISRKHFAVFYSEETGLSILNAEPRNKTAIQGHEMPKAEIEQPRNIVEAKATVVALARVAMPNALASNPKETQYDVHGNPIISRHTTRFNGAVSYGEGEREAILVDGNSVEVRALYEDIAIIADHNKATTPDQLLKVVHTVIMNRLPYNSTETDKISAPYKGDKIIPISTYLREGAGVCRHQGLLAAHMVERLIESGRIDGGEAHFERNELLVSGSKHGYAVYKPREGEDIVVDPAQKYIGPRDGGRWPYNLPVESTGEIS